VFSSLESLRGGFGGSVVLDLYAGSGALGLEALSRGASHVDLVESNREAVRVIEANAQAVLSSCRASSPSSDPVVHVHATGVQRWLATGGAANPSAAGSSYDVVFCDPPYATPADEVGDVLSTLVAAGRLAVDALVIVERARRDAPWSWPPGLTALRDRAYGEAHLWIGGLVAGADSSDSVAPC
jgi:16S rRNA (guanine966-N2)-methyltransferase